MFGYTNLEQVGREGGTKFCSGVVVKKAVINYIVITEISDYAKLPTGKSDMSFRPRKHV